MDGKPHFEVFPEVKATVTRGDVPTGQFCWHFKDPDGDIAFIGRKPFRERQDAHRAIHESIGLLLGVVRIRIANLEATVPIIDLGEDGREMIDVDACDIAADTEGDL